MQYDYEAFVRALGARVKDLRKARGLTHRQMVAEYDFHLNQLHRIEKGEPVSVQTLLKLCHAFNLTMDELVKGLALVDEFNPE